jgi:hypothetical protein
MERKRGGFAPWRIFWLRGGREMLKALGRACVLFFLTLTSVPRLLAQQVISFIPSGCKESHTTFAPVGPRRSADETILPGQMIMQLDLSLSTKTRVVVTEYPDTAGYEDYYNSVITAYDTAGPKVYRVSRLLKHAGKEDVRDDSDFRLDEIASFCGRRSGRVILVFEAGGSMTVQGFILIDYSPTSISVKGFPWQTIQGSLSLDPTKPDRAQLWSAVKPGPGIECTACDKYYAVEDCRINDAGIKCARRRGLIGPLSPTKFTEYRIQIRGQRRR